MDLDAKERARRRASWPGHVVRDGWGEAPRLGDAAARLAAVREVSETAWALTGRPWPSYARSEMPGRVIRPDE